MLKLVGKDKTLCGLMQVGKVHRITQTKNQHSNTKTTLNLTEYPLASNHCYSKL